MNVKSALLGSLIILGTVPLSAKKQLQPQDLIKAVRVSKNRVDIAVNDAFKIQFLTSDFFAEYDDDEDIDLRKVDQSLVIMPFIMNVVTAVWISGKDYYVESLDRELWESLQRLKEVFSYMYPNTSWEGNLIPRKLVDNVMPFRLNDSHEALLFSGGLDSTSSSLYHKEKNQLLITAWGQWDLPLSDPTLWKTVQQRIVAFAHRFGHKNSFIKSNYAEFLNYEVLENLSQEVPLWRFNAIENIGWAGLTAPLLFLKGYTLLRIASSDSWHSPYPCAAHPFIDNNITFAGIKLAHDQFDFTRLNKIEFISRVYEKSNKKPFLTVCQGRTDKNCCNCSKCLATIMGFIAIGQDPAENGFATSKQKALKRVSKYVKNEELDYPFIIRLKEIQKRIKAHPPKGSSLKDFEKFLNLEFDKALAGTSEVRFQQKMNWRLLQNLFPSIEVPDEILESSPTGRGSAHTRSFKQYFKPKRSLFAHEAHSDFFVDKWEFAKRCDFAYDPETDPLMYPLSEKKGGVTFDPKKVKAGDTIFLRARHAADFFKKFAPKIEHPFIIVAHGEYKDAFDCSYMHYLDHPNLIAWFGTHPCPQPHEKFHTIPLGVWVNHRESLKQAKLANRFKMYRNREKSKLVYANFSLWTHPEREELFNFLRNKAFCSLSEPQLPFTDYLDEMADYAFTFSPRGLGIDCYRTWEALLVGSIPIVKHSYLDPLFEELPVLIVDDWKLISKEFLLEKYAEITSRSYNLNKLYMGHWLNQIKEVRDAYLERQHPPKHERTSTNRSQHSGHQERAFTDEPEHSEKPESPTLTQRIGKALYYYFGL